MRTSSIAVLSSLLGVATALFVLVMIFRSRRAVESLMDESEEYTRPSVLPMVPINYGIEVDETGRRRPNVPEQVHLSYFGPNRMLVSFTTSAYDVPSVVEWGVEPGKYIWQAVGFTSSYNFISYKSGLIHHVVLGDEHPLQPRCKYYYKCAKMGKEFSFTMPPPLGRNVPVKFGLLGDLGQTEWSVSTLEQLQKASVDMVLFAGDLSYADAYQPRWDTWGRLIQPSASSIPWMVVEGNHEKEGLFGFEPEFKAYNARWQLPYKESGSESNLYYSFEVAGVHVLMLGAYSDFDENSLQYKWLKGNLAQVDRQRTPWLIALFHAPWYNSNYAHKGDAEPMRRAVEALLYTAKVDMVFTGHVHAYERTKPIINWSVTPCGITYIVVGDGGNREGLARRYISPPPIWSEKREASFGFGLLDVVNRTHAKWVWHRNQDPSTVVADDVWLRTMGDPSHPCHGHQHPIPADITGRKP